MDHQKMVVDSLPCLQGMFSLVGNYAGEEKASEVWKDVSIMICLYLSQKLWAMIWQPCLKPSLVEK